MNVAELINKEKETAFSFEILPPLKGADSYKLFRDIETLLEFSPKYINVTSHRSEVEYRTLPHVICSGFIKSETEYALIDLHYLGITNLLLLRGDRAKNEKNFAAMEDGHAHASDLQVQVNDFNKGRFIDGSEFEAKKDLERRGDRFVRRRPGGTERPVQ